MKMDANTDVSAYGVKQSVLFEQMRAAAFPDYFYTLHLGRS